MLHEIMGQTRKPRWLQKHDPGLLWFGCFALVLAYFALVTGHVLLEVWCDCHLYYDIGIYTDGIGKLSLQNLNPWLSARNLFLFNDHVDPIVWLARPFVHAMALPYGGVVFEALVAVFACVPFVWLCRAGLLHARAAVLLTALMLFNLGATTAVHYPIHPTTWAMAPWVWMVVALERRRYRLAAFAFVLLMACKEEFPFVAVPLAWLLWRRRQRGFAVACVAVAGLWLFAVYGLRPYWLGDVQPYWQKPFAVLQHDPAYIWRKLVLHSGFLQQPLLMVAPLLPLLLLLRRRKTAAGTWAYLALVLPPLAIRFLAAQWHHHYHAVTAAGLIVAFVPMLKRTYVPAKVLWTSLGILALTNVPLLRNAYALATVGSAPRYNYCARIPARQQALQTARGLLRQDGEAPMLIGMNLLPKLVDLPHVYLLDMPQKNSARPYRYVFFEKPWRGADWPTTYKRIRALQQRWRLQADTEMLIDDDYVFLARGTFDDAP